CEGMLPTLLFRPTDAPDIRARKGAQHRHRGGRRCTEPASSQTPNFPAALVEAPQILLFQSTLSFPQPTSRHAPCLFLADVFYLCRARRLGSAAGRQPIPRQVCPRTTATQINRKRYRTASCSATYSPPTTRLSASTICGLLCSAFFSAWRCRCSCVSIWLGRK